MDKVLRGGTPMMSPTGPLYVQMHIFIHTEFKRNITETDKLQQHVQALHFHNCKDVRLSSIHHKNSPRNHISIDTCNSLEISHIHITAPEESPNTDGIDISGSSNIFIHSSHIQTGN